jgi:hypothetical protein
MHFYLRHDESVCTSDGPVNAGDTLLTQPFSVSGDVVRFGLALPWRFWPLCFYQFHSASPTQPRSVSAPCPIPCVDFVICTNAWFLDLEPPQTGYGFCCRTRALDALQRDGEDVLSMFIVARPFRSSSLLGVVLHFS